MADDRIYRAFTSSAVPCNPRPFLIELERRCQTDSGFIATPDGKRLLYNLLVMAYGQMATIDLVDEYRALAADIEPLP